MIAPGKNRALAATCNRLVVVGGVVGHGFPSRLFNYFPMPAFVGADAAKTAGCLEIYKMLLDGATGYS